jgi:hypothetical protein
MRSKRIPILGLAVAAGFGLLAFSAPAHADWHHRYWHGHPWYHGYPPPAVVVAPPAYYAPPPVYYAPPPPVVYAPPPVYYAPPGISIGVRLP